MVCVALLFQTSPYPVIISLENHCSVDQQKVMAQHMTTILQDMLLVAPVDGNKSQFPSPEVSKATPAPSEGGTREKFFFLLSAKLKTQGENHCK